MEATAVLEPVVELPKMLRNILQTLLKDNNIRSWSLYSDVDTTLKIRFEQADIAGTALSRTHDQNGNTASQAVHYMRKPPCKQRRDTMHSHQYKLNRNRKRQRVESTPEMARDCDTSTVQCLDTPESAFCDHIEEKLILMPIAPVELIFDNNDDMNCKIIDGDILIENSNGSVNWECCDEPMIDGNHICDDTASNSTTDTCLTKNSDTKDSHDSSVFCFIAEKNESYAPKVHDSDLSICHGCGRYCCRTCLVTYGLHDKSRWRWYACCKNMSHSSPSHYRLTNTKLK